MHGGSGSNLHRLLPILLLATQYTMVVAYIDAPIEVVLSGFHIGEIKHEVSTNQIVMQITLSASPNIIPMIYISKPGWDVDNPASENLSTHPCEGGTYVDNNVCCLNSVVANYQTGPCMHKLYDNSGICPYDNVTQIWAQNYTEMSSNNAQLREHLMAGIGVLDFLSIGTENVSYIENVTVLDTTTNISRVEQVTKYSDVLTYPEGVSYEVLDVQDGMFTVELRLNHLYLKPRSRKTEVDGSSSGVVKYEFYMGVTFVTLLPYTSAVSISTAQVSFEYFKSEFVFLSIATEQEATPVQQLDIVIQQAKSINNDNQYQYMEFDFRYDFDRYSGPVSIKPDSLRWTRKPSITGLVDADWSYPCLATTGDYYTGDKAALDDMAEQTCLPEKPYFCQFDADRNFFMPFPTEYATPTSGFVSASDTVNNLYLQFVVELTDGNGFKHLSTVFFSVDLASWPVLEQCQDAEFDYNDVSGALKITATVGVKDANSSSVVLSQSTTANRIINEIAPAV
jgi:hypothetical protein